ncbi:MAG: hypothetical protein RI894_1864 [Bacteroidota bacterium]|jgi:hypothetical protein
MSKKTEETEVVAEAANEQPKAVETGRVDEAQVAAWKKEHKAVYIKEIACRISENETAYVYLKAPSRDVVALALAAPKETANKAAKTINMGTVVLNNCLVGGDERVKTDDTFYLSVVAEAASMITFYETESKNL